MRKRIWADIFSQLTFTFLSVILLTHQSSSPEVTENASEYVIYPNLFGVLENMSKGG